MVANFILKHVKRIVFLSFFEPFLTRLPSRRSADMSKKLPNFCKSSIKVFKKSEFYAALESVRRSTK
jgi:hypothetical protein